MKNEKLINEGKGSLFLDVFKLTYPNHKDELVVDWFELKKLFKEYGIK